MFVANLLEQFQSLRCMYASSGCASEVKYEDLLSHHEECGFAPVQCSHEGCEATVNRQDVVSHQQTCEFRSVTCEECQETMRQREYGKHPCVFRREIDENKHGLAEIQKILREIQDKQVSSLSIGRTYHFFVKRKGFTIQVEFSWFLPCFEGFIRVFRFPPHKEGILNSGQTRVRVGESFLNSRVPVKREQELHHRQPNSYAGL